MKFFNFFLLLCIIFALLDPDPDPLTRLNPDPPCNFEADPDPACHFVADPDPACHFDADPDLRFQIKAQNFLKVLK